MTVVDSTIVERMTSAMAGCNAVVVQDRFGIGLNTWAKLRKGEAIRLSVAQRLLVRLERDMIC